MNDQSVTRLKLTHAVVNKATRGKWPQRLYFDTTVKGFGLLVGAKTKTFIVQHSVKGRLVRCTIGRLGIFTLDEARHEAKQKLAMMALGRDPVAEARAARAQGITFGEAAREYVEDNRTKLSPKTIEGYEQTWRLYLRHLDKRPLIEIEAREIYELHKSIMLKVEKRKGEGRGGYSANGAIRFFRAVHNDAAGKYPKLPANPVRGMRKKWAKEHRRKSALPPEQLARWYRAVMHIENPIRRDYLRLVLFTGLRRNSATAIRWADIDLFTRTLRLPNPKGGKERAFTLPLSDYLVELLRARRTENETIYPESPWVFPAASASGHISEPKEQLTDDNGEPLVLIDAEGNPLKWHIHALRNTFTTVAEHVANVPRTTVKTLLNHSQKEDVTSGYSNPTVEHLRPAMQSITNSLLTICEAAPIGNNVVALPRRAL